MLAHAVAEKRDIPGGGLDGGFGMLDGGGEGRWGDAGDWMLRRCGCGRRHAGYWIN